MEPLFLSVQQKLDRLNTVLQENIAGVRLVKALCAPIMKAGDLKSEPGLHRAEYPGHAFMSVMGPVLTVLVNIGMVIVIYAGGMKVIQGTMTVGQIVAFTNY